MTVTSYIIMKSNSLNNDAMWIDYGTLLNDALLGEPKQQYRENAKTEHLLYDVMQFRETADKLCKELEKDAKHLKYKTTELGNWKHEVYYKNELEKLENEVFKNYCYCILLGQSFDVFYKTKGKNAFTSLS